jgi:hypothetical protein
VENTALGFPNFNTGDGVQKCMAGMPDDQAQRVWELHTLENIGWNYNAHCPIKCWSQDILRSIRWLILHTAFANLLIYALQCGFNSCTPLKCHYTAMYTVDM